MKIALVGGPAKSAVDQVMQTLAKELKVLGQDVTIFNSPDVPTEEDFVDFDHVHYGYYGYIQDYGEWIMPPLTVNVWHIPVPKIAQHTQMLYTINPARIIVDDTTSLQILGQLGFFNVTKIPLLFDHTRFRVLPPPASDFTVGVFGANYPDGSKRFEIAEIACKMANVNYYPVLKPPGETEFALDPMEDVYAKIHALAHCSMMDMNSLVCLEALACGRPVLATHSYGLERTVCEGLNGYFFDGSPDMLAEIIQRCKDNYDTLSWGAAMTAFPPPAASAAAYLKVFEKAQREFVNPEKLL